MILKKWQRARDSNPRRREPRRFSKPVHSTNSVNSLHNNNSGANGENRTHTPKPEWDFKSHASTYSATLALKKEFKKDVFLKLEWNYIKKIILCQEF